MRKAHSKLSSAGSALLNDAREQCFIAPTRRPQAGDTAQLPGHWVQGNNMADLVIGATASQRPHGNPVV